MYAAYSRLARQDKRDATSLRGSASTGSSRRGGATIALVVGSAGSSVLVYVLFADGVRLVRAAHRLANSSR